MFPSLLHFGRTLAQRQLGWAHTHPPSPSPSPPQFLTGELSSCNPIITCHCRGNPAGGPPSKCLPALARSRPGQGADTQEPGWVPGSPARRRGATRAPADAHAPYISGAHSGAHPCARAPPHSGVRTPLSGQGLPCRRRPGVVGALSRVSLQGSAGRPAPPRPSNPPSRARLGLQSFAFSPPRQRAGLGSARLCVAPDCRDRWPSRAPGCAPRSAPRPARISASRAPACVRSQRALLPQGLFSASCASSISFLLLPGGSGPFASATHHGSWPRSDQPGTRVPTAAAAVATAAAAAPGRGRQPHGRRSACPARGRRRPCRGQEPPAVSRRRGRCTEPRRPGHGCCPHAPAL